MGAQDRKNSRRQTVVFISVLYCFSLWNCTIYYFGVFCTRGIAISVAPTKCLFLKIPNKFNKSLNTKHIRGLLLQIQYQLLYIFCLIFWKQHDLSFLLVYYFRRSTFFINQCSNKTLIIKGSETNIRKMEISTSVMKTSKCLGMQIKQT